MTKQKILNLIRFNGPISRVSIAEKLEISNTAVTQYVNELISEGIVLEVGTEKSSGGRKPTLLDINPEYGYIIGIDFGQSVFRIAVFDLQNRCLNKETVPTSDLQQPEQGINMIIRLAKKLQANTIPGKRLLAVGIAVSGINFVGDGDYLTIPYLPGWKEINFKKPFEKEFNVPVYVDDSPRMTALLESIIPSNGRYKNLIYVNIGVGLGTGIIIFGRLFRGSTGLAGELGHTIVEENGLVCACGNHGCLEQYASVSAMVNSAKKQLMHGVRSSILDYAGGDIDRVNSFALARALKDRDKLAFSIVINAGTYLGKGIAQMINLFNPERIIVGGGGINISDEIIDEIIKTCKIRAMNESVKTVQIVKSDKGDDSALLGVSIFSQDNLFGLTKIQEESLF
jgi:predicted NBD/HSP70 family sugar kinase/biotin operon repressor